MRLIKMFGLAALVAVAAMAFVGASSAVAKSTQLCKKDTQEVPAPSAAECERATAIHYITVGAGLTPGHAKLVAHFLGSSITIECNGLLSGTAPNELKTNGSISFAGTLSYSNCLNDCTITVIKQGTISILNLNGELADQTGSGFELLVECPVLHCIYGFTNLVGHVLGPLVTGTGHDHITYNGQTITKISGFLCPNTTLLFASYQDLSAIYPRE